MKQRWKRSKWPVSAIYPRRFNLRRLCIREVTWLSRSRRWSATASRSLSIWIWGIWSSPSIKRRLPLSLILNTCLFSPPHYNCAIVTMYRVWFNFSVTSSNNFRIPSHRCRSQPSTQQSRRVWRTSSTQPDYQCNLAPQNQSPPCS